MHQIVDFLSTIIVRHVRDPFSQHHSNFFMAFPTTLYSLETETWLQEVSKLMQIQISHFLSYDTLQRQPPGTWDEDEAVL